MNKMTDEQQEAAAFTPEQIKAIKAVEKAMNKCAELGVNFWDNYGQLTAYNDKKITMPSVFNDGEFRYNRGEYYGCIKGLWLDNFYAGNADDPMTFNIK